MDTEISVNRGFAVNAKAADLRSEAADAFSDAPFDFENTTLALWDDTQKIYYHACTENRFSENYLQFCAQLEKNIRQLGSFCITKAALEQKGIKLPKLSEMSIRELVGMASFHFRKAHAALDGVYRDNNILAMNYLNWELRWVGIGNQLKATEVKIKKIKEGTFNVDPILEQTEVFKNEKADSRISTRKPIQSLPVNPKALPIKGSIAREMIRIEAERKKSEARIIEQKIRALREMFEMSGSEAKPFEPPAPFSEPPAFEPLKQTAQPPKPPEKKPESGMISEGEARKILIEEALKKGDQAAVMAIQHEDSPSFRARWHKHTEDIRAENARLEAAARGPSPETRKALREKRKKKK